MATNKNLNRLKFVKKASQPNLNMTVGRELSM